MRLTLVRSATLLIDTGGAVPTLLVDAMLNPPGAVDPVEDTAPAIRNPLVPLPLPVVDVVAQAGIVLLTHLHNDHFDATARREIPAETPVLCQPADLEALASAGFVAVEAVEDEHTLAPGAVLHRVGARHTLGAHVGALGDVSGFVLTAPDMPTTYVASDSVWCEEVAATLDRFDPSIVVVNAGAARFLTDGPISMTAEDVIAVCRHAPQATVVAVHLEALNHCPMTRAEIRRHATAAGIGERLVIPVDGEELRF